jgi:hypothetical protein
MPPLRSPDATAERGTQNFKSARFPDIKEDPGREKQKAGEKPGNVT